MRRMCRRLWTPVSTVRANQHDNGVANQWNDGRTHENDACDHVTACADDGRWDFHDVNVDGTSNDTGVHERDVRGAERYDDGATNNARSECGNMHGRCELQRACQRGSTRRCHRRVCVRLRWRMGCRKLLVLRLDALRRPVQCLWHRPVHVSCLHCCGVYLCNAPDVAVCTHRLGSEHFANEQALVDARRGDNGGGLRAVIHLRAAWR